MIPLAKFSNHTVVRPNALPLPLLLRLYVAPTTYTAMLLCNFGFGSGSDARKAIDFILDDQAKKDRKAKLKSGSASSKSGAADLVNG